MRIGRQIWCRLYVEFSEIRSAKPFFNVVLIFFLILHNFVIKFNQEKALNVQTKTQPSLS